MNFDFSPEKISVAVDMLLHDMPYALWETLYATFVATLFAIIIGLPLGILLAVGGKDGIVRVPKWVLSAIGVIINLLRSVPFIILMVIVVPLTRVIVGTSIGTAASVVPLVIAAFPFVARLAESSIREVNPNIIEAAQSMGASPFQIIVKVLIPECVPSLISNLTIAFTTILGYTAMSGAVGGGGLGNIAIMYGYQRYNYPVIVFAVVILIAVVQVFQSLGTFLSVKLDRRIKHK